MPVSSGAGYGGNTPNGRASQDQFNRPFTLQEALPYTPFTSIVPFNSDIIPTPNLASASPATDLTDIIATADFDALNTEVLSSQQPASKRMEQALTNFRTLLDPKRLPQYNFRVSPKTIAGTAPDPPMGNNISLSPFTRLVVDQTSVSYRYPTPDTPGMPSTDGNSKPPATPKPASPIARKVEKPKQSPKQSSSTQADKQSQSHNNARCEIVLPNKPQLYETSRQGKTNGVTPSSQPLPRSSASSTSSVPPPPQPRPPSVPAVQAAPSLPTTPVIQAPPAIPSYHPAPVNQRTQSALAGPVIQPVPHIQAMHLPLVTPSKSELAGDVIIVNPNPATPKSAAPKATSVPPSEPRAGSQTLGTPSKHKIAIELSRAKSFNKNEYLVVPDGPDEPGTWSSRKRKREEYDGNRDVLGQSLGHRERAQAAYQDLQRCFQEVFHAEQYAVDHRTSNAVVYFTLDGEPTISPAVQQKVQSLVEKSIDLNCFKQVPLDDLLHVIRLSEGALKHAESLDLKIEEAWGASEIELWLQLLPDVDAGLKAARTALRMMCGGREDKQLYSEGTIEQALSLFKHVLDGIIVPLAELRNTGEIFKLLSQQRDRIGHLLTTCQRLFTLMTTLISTIDTSETVMNTLEFASSTLVFVETAHAEKESVVETHRFDSFRLVAMDMLSQVFLLNPQQRQGIFDDILTSLEKLPVGKQRARQFKLVDGTNIQPVSALIMRLVQVTAGKADDAKFNKRSVAMLSMEMEDGEEAESDDRPSSRAPLFTVNSEEQGEAHHGAAISELQDMVKPLMTSAMRNAHYVINFIVKRALKSTKTGDTPYRNLLDLFVEDFTSCLNNPDWPASELLLQILMRMMVNIVDGDKSPAPAKNMALEVLGVINAAISRVRSYVRKTAHSLDTSEAGDLGIFLVDLGLSALSLRSRPELMVSWSGPYRATLEHLEERHADDPHLGSAISFLISQWADKVCTSYDLFDEDDDERDRKYGQLAYRLRMMVQDRRWLKSEYSFKSVSPKHALLAYAVTLLRSQLCEAFSAILNILLKSMASDQATVRSKSLRSINQVLETDPSILDGDSVVVQLILQCSSDSSTQVRDSALGLIGKCISMRPVLEEKMADTVIQRFSDTGPGVRKRAMKLAKDIYLRNPSKDMRSAIANALLHRVQDPEESVRDLALQMIEEIWFTPFAKGESSAASKISLTDHVTLMVQTLKQGKATTVLDKVLQSMLASGSKSAPIISEVCTKLVESMFDMVNNLDSDDPSIPSGRDALQVLVIFSKADASLFNFEQIRLLKPYIDSVESNDDRTALRAVIMIYRRVLPQLSKAHTQFLDYVRTKLAPAVSKVPRPLVDDIFACLWIISGLLESTGNLARLVASVLQKIFKMRAMNIQQAGEFVFRQFERLCLIAGMAGKHCDLDSNLDFFKEKFPSWNGTSISKLMVDIIVTFTDPKWPLDMRKSALDAVGLVCQSWPKNYVSPNVYTMFQRVFDEQNPVLESLILRSLKEFLLIEEQRSEEASGKESTGKTADTPKKRELTVMGGTAHDDVASATTQRFLKEITRISLASQDEYAFLAIEVLASINRQGLVHPKETGVTFITLETSSVVPISELAYSEHKALHEKHETVLEREYVRAFQAAFAYQRDIVKDPRGATTNPFVSKLHLMMEALKVSKSKNRQKFLEKLVAQIDFDLARLDVSEEIPGHVQFSRFLIENMAFFEYITIGELQATVAATEKLFSTTGAPVAHAIESEVFQVRMMAIDAPTTQFGSDGQPVSAEPVIEYARLRQLTAASMILLSLWEARTYLRRLYGMGTARKDPKAKAQAKDLNRAPVKAQNVNGDKFWDDISLFMGGLLSRERMMETCRSFVDLMNVDKELKIADEDEELNGEDPTTPSNEDDDGDESIMNSGRGRKRKASGTPAGRKKRARSSSQQPRKKGRTRKQNSAVVDEDADGEFDDGWA